MRNMCIFMLLFSALGFSEGNLQVFQAAFFSPIMESLQHDAERTLRIKINTESGGSMTLVRKISELKRECDIIILADPTLFKKMMPGESSWRIDFIADFMVLAVGTKAKYVDQAEKDWKSVLVKPDVLLARADENLSPLGYRSLMCWALAEDKRYPHLKTILTNKCSKVIEDAEQLSAFLKSGDCDYAFMYKSSCTAHDIRFIELTPDIDLSSLDHDYSKVSVPIRSAKGDQTNLVQIKGAPIIYSLTVPNNALKRTDAVAMIRYIMKNLGNIAETFGMKNIKPRFFGADKDYAPFADVCIYKGEFQ